jgi:hypothetical protein
MEPLRELALDFVVTDDCAGFRGNLGHGIPEIDGIGQTEELLDKGDLRTFANDNQIPCMAHPRVAVSSGNENQVNRLLAHHSAGNFNVSAVREECRIPGRKRVIGRFCVSPKMLLDDRAPLRISESFTDRQHVELQPGISSGEPGIEAAIDKHQTRARVCLEFGDRRQRTVDCGLECHPADRSHIRVLPVFQPRRRKTEREKVVHPLLPQPFEPGQTAARQPLQQRNELSGVHVLFYSDRAHEIKTSSSHP